MRPNHYDRNSGFNPAVVRDLLLGLTISPEIEARLRVPAARLEQWVRELADRLEERYSLESAGRSPAEAGVSAPCAKSAKLSAGEIRFLLEG